MFRFPLPVAAGALCIASLVSSAAAGAPATIAPPSQPATTQTAQMHDHITPQMHDHTMPMAVEPAAGGPAGAASAGPVRIEGAYVRASLGAAPNSAAYMTLSTTGAADRLVAASTPAATSAGLHTHTVDSNNVMRMRPVDGIAVKPGDATVMKPGGLHVMLMGLKGPLKDGETIPLTLTFEKAGTVTVQVPVRGLSAMRRGTGRQGGGMR